MKNTALVAVALFGLAAGFVRPASASTVASLNDWCFNVNGDVADLCNGGNTPTLTGSVNGIGVSGNLDLTLASSDPGFPTTAAPNALGSASFVIGAGSSYVNAYMDYDLNYDNEGSYSDYAVVNNPGSLPAGYSYEVDDPNTSNLYAGQGNWPGDFGNSTLLDVNNVGTFSTTANNNPCCDVSWALGVAVDVASGFQDTVTFNVSTTAPTSGFYLQQSNGIDTTQNIYFSATVTSQQVGPPASGTPEPGTFLLLGAGLAGLIAWYVRGRVQASA